MRPPLRGGTILVTGASSGIGREMARQLGPVAGALVLVARRQDRLEQLRAELQRARPELVVSVQPCDLGDLAAAAKMVEAARAEVGEIDVLINNAGFGDFCLVECAAWEKLDRMITLNVAALTLLTQHLLGPMVERGRGGILNVSSGFGLTFLPGFASYVGTKHYVTAFTEALRTELRGTGVVVSQVCPGPVDTEFDQVTNEVSDLSTPRILSISPERCARAALRGFARGRALIIPGGLIWVLLWLGRLTPRPLLRLVYSVFGRFLRRRLPSRSRLSLPGPKPDAR